MKVSVTFTMTDPVFPLDWGPNPQGEGCQHMILPNVPKNCMKLKEFVPQEGGGHTFKILLYRSITNSSAN